VPQILPLPQRINQAAIIGCFSARRAKLIGVSCLLSNGRGAFLVFGTGATVPHVEEIPTMFNCQHMEWLRILIYPFGHILWTLVKKLKSLDLRKVEFQILKTKDEGGLHVVWHRQQPIAELPVQETEKPALPKPKASKPKQAK
jgi:hypothetical protein